MGVVWLGFANAGMGSGNLTDASGLGLTGATQMQSAAVSTGSGLTRAGAVGV